MPHPADLIRLVTRITIACGVALTLLAMNRLGASAQVSGPCYLTGYESPRTITEEQLGTTGSQKDVVAMDLSSVSTWNVKRNGSVLVAGETAVVPNHLRVVTAFFGVGLPFFDSQGNSQKANSGSWAMQDLAPFTRVLGFSGTTDSCSGTLQVVIDENPLITVAGAGAALGAAIGSIGLIRLALRRRKIAWRGAARPSYKLRRRFAAVLLGILFGLLFGAGEGLYMQEVGTFSPLDRRALVVVAVGLLLGVTAGILGGRRSSRYLSRGLVFPPP
jgi:hypothetical protein